MRIQSCSGLLGLSLLLGGAAQADDPASLAAKPVAFTLTVSGGISLGSYEAGYNWALIRQLKKRKAAAEANSPPLELAAVTGASAGSINTFLSAVTWCQTDEKDKGEFATTNVFHQTWVPIGLPGLIPADGVYKDTDAYLSTAAFDAAQETLRQYTAQADFRAGCVLPIGMTVTRKEPVVIEDNSLQAPVDRFSIALEARTAADGTLQFFDSRLEDESFYVRPYLHFTDPKTPGQCTSEGPLAWDNVITGLKASSAFPIAFGQQHLAYCGASETNPEELKHSEEWFWDGGLYDNVPVSLALSLLEKPPFQRPSRAAQFQMFSIDPDRRRDAKVPDAIVQSTEPPKGMKNLEKIAGDFFSVSRKYEMQNFIRFAAPVLSQCKSPPGAAGDASCWSAMVSSRFMPVFGERLGAFGAFVLQAFREFDFGAGIYDALHAFAERDCGPHIQDQCRVERIFAGYQDLQLDDDQSAPAGFLVRALVREELEQRLGEKPARELLSKLTLENQSAWDWANNQSASKKVKVPAYAKVLLADAKRVLSQGEPDNLENELTNIEQLAESLSEDASLPQADRALLEDPDWFNSNAMNLLSRAEKVERKDNFPAGKTITATALFLARTSQSLWRTGMQWDPSTVPDDLEKGELAWHLVPYHLSLSYDLAQVGWQPTLGLAKWLAVGVPLSASGRWGPQAPYHVGAHGGVSLSIRPPTAWLPAIELTPFRVTINEVGGFQQPSYGFEVAVYTAGGKIRVAYVADNYQLGDRWVPYQTTRLTVGVADLNGILFHYAR